MAYQSFGCLCILIVAVVYRLNKYRLTGTVIPLDTMDVFLKLETKLKAVRLRYKILLLLEF